MAQRGGYSTAAHAKKWTPYCRVARMHREGAGMQLAGTVRVLVMSKRFWRVLLLHTAKIWPSSWIWAVYNSSPFQKRFGTTDNVKKVRIVKEVKVLDCGCQESRSKHSSTPICQLVNHSYADDKWALIHKRARG